MSAASQDEKDLWLGRLWREGVGPVVVALREGALFDITSRDAPLVRDILEMDDPADYGLVGKRGGAARSQGATGSI